MYFSLVRRRELGTAIPADQLRRIPPMKADVHIADFHSPALGRVSTQAWVFNPTPSQDLIPRLLDVKITGMAQGGMNLTGLEEVEGVLYAQSWWCRAG